VQCRTISGGTESFLKEMVKPFMVLLPFVHRIVARFLETSRLGTRTKESDIFTSLCDYNRSGKMKVNSVVNADRTFGLSLSKYVGTRKMMNYS